MRPSHPSTDLLDGATYARLCRARDFLAAAYNQRVTLSEAARQACLSPFHFHRLFVLAFGETPHEFLTRRRLDEAKRRLAAGTDCPTDICFDIGYSSLGSFSWWFRSRVGCSPRQFRRIFAVPFSWQSAIIPYCFLSLFAAPCKPQDPRRISSPDLSR